MRHLVCLVLLISGIIRAETVIPFEYRDGLIWVKVESAASARPLNFLLDSGAGASVLDLQTARRLGVKLGSQERVRRVGADAGAWRVREFRASVSGIALGRSPLAIDLSETSRECSRSIDGLIGQDFFRNRVVEIDFKARCIRCPEKVDATRGGTTVMPLKIAHDVMCVPVSVDGSSPQWTRLDTGCDDALHWVSKGGSGYATTSLQLGNERIAGVKTALHRTPIFPSEAGLLGNGILSGYRVTIDAVNRRLLLERS